MVCSEKGTIAVQYAAFLPKQLAWLSAENFKSLVSFLGDETAQERTREMTLSAEDLATSAAALF